MKVVNTTDVTVMVDEAGTLLAPYATAEVSADDRTSALVAQGTLVELLPSARPETAPESGSAPSPTPAAEPQEATQ